MSLSPARWTSRRAASWRAQAARNALIGLLLGAALPACSSLSATVSCPKSVCLEQPAGLVGLMRYAEAITAMDTAARQREYLRVEAKFLDGQATTDRLMLVLLLSAPGAPFRDDARARGLLREYMGNDDDAYREFARFLLRSLNERRAMEQALDAERKHTQQLRKQVEELKAIEQDMNQRDQVKE